MPDFKLSENKIFTISTPSSFNETALEIFHFQYKNNPVYRHFTDYLGIRPADINEYTQIPFLPIEFFKDHRIVSGDFIEEAVFKSSGTTGMQTGKHFIKSLSLYEHSFLTNFEQQFGPVKDFVILALLPSYLERQGSSLVYMMDKLIRFSGDENSGFYLYDYDRLAETLKKLKNTPKKVLLMGVTYALLELAEKHPIRFPELILMETGGMKGMRREMIREELHTILKEAFGVEQVYSEYGMTELLSQAYALRDGNFQTPPWMKILIRDINDPLALVKNGQSGGINIIDLANIHSCSFIATKDLGRKTGEDTFEMLGRYDDSDVRGCNLLIV
jgi:phenylacetate-coenzyme A ligase PaaK-like adenylate-forming protein